jgi:4-amino-4-deoxychorismate lyase
VESPLHELAPADLQVIETLGYVPGLEAEGGFRRLQRHLDRAQRTCARLRIAFDRRACEAALRAAVTGTAARCRLTIDRAGRLEVTTATLAPTPARWRVMVSPTRLAANDPWLAVKTTQRLIYDKARAALPPDIDEAIFLNEAGAVCEGTITNIFARLDGRLVTPPLDCGLLPGILREELLESGEAIEQSFGLAELQRADQILVGNALRGLIPCELVRP